MLVQKVPEAPLQKRVHASDKPDKRRKTGPLGFIARNGDVSAYFQETDFSQTPLGSIEHWPKGLCSALSIALSVGCPIVIYWGSDSRLLYNDAFCSFLSGSSAADSPYTHGRLSLLCPAQDVWGRDWNVLAPLLEQVRATGQARMSEPYPLSVWRSGHLEERSFRYDLSPIWSEDGQVEGVLNIIVEIQHPPENHNYWHAEEKNGRLCGVSFRQIIESNIIGILVANLDGHVIEANDYFINMLGYNRNDLEAGLLRWRKITPPEFEEVDRKKRIELCEQGVCTPFEKQYLHKEGYRIDVLLEAVRLEKDACIYYIADISKAKQSERDMRELEMRFRSLADATSIIIFVSDSQGNVSYYNKAGRQFLGEEALKKTTPTALEDFIHPDDLTHVLNLRSAAVDQCAPFTYECRLKNYNGEYRWLLLSASPRFIGEEFQGYVTSGMDITERQEAENAIRESEQRFRTMADASPNLISVHDPEDNVIYYNRAAIEFLGGKNLEDVIDLSWRTIVHPDDLQGFIDKRTKAMERYQSYQHECRVKDKEGQYRWLLVFAAPRFTGNACQGYVTSNIDITERKKAESALEESETRFRTLAEAAPVHIWMSDPQGNVIYSNRIVPQFQDGTHTVGLNWQDTLHPDDLDSFLKIQSSAVKKRLDYEGEWRFKNKEGDYRWLFMSAVPRFVAEKFEGYIASTIDITERKLAENALKESEQLFKTIADTVPAMIYMHDENDVIEFSNKALLEFAGNKLEDVVGLPVGSERWNGFIHPDDLNRLFPDYQEKFKKKDPYTYELRIRCRDGSYRWTTDSGVARYDNIGRFVGYIGAYTDIEQLKETERQNNELMENLEKKVIERTVELEAVNRELESFSYSVSHDLRAPLRGIDGMSLAILEDYQDRLDDKGRKYLEILRKEAQHMGELINEMLNLSRLTRGELHWGLVNLSEVAAEVAENLKWQEPQRQVIFNIEPNVIVQGDSHLLRAVLENLMGNAWKFTSKHSTATIQFGVQSQDGQPVYFVKDDGAGFDMEYAEKLFNVFQRLHTTSEFPGSGIGLATVQRVVHRHGGRVWAQGEVEKGAQIFLR